ncbi:TadG family pilus assembly protein [Pseudomonas violetae]|uniref:Pilus assembly protein TadG-related protein n=1 Tax=Pseudomonas violetae TaxID=2915813 RepID=A0ABT0F5X2_9PSED|nr:pilus assembly protein TadG-related protein [Pseudomonas violetae]MCK1793333.1 pilus assembly protein TadG-related protein [Pseudomonas violetae]
MSPRLQFHSPARQRGAIGLMAALTLGLAMLFMLLVLDSGRLYLEQRKLQRVADVAALEAVTRDGDCLANLTAAKYSTESARRNGLTVADGITLTTTCGVLLTGADKLRSFTPDASKKEAIRVIATRVVPTSIAAGVGALFSPGPVSLNTQLTATAVSAPAVLPPLAMLTIGSTALVVDSSKSAALNLLLGKMLGGSLDLSVVGWQGLVDTHINLLSYLNQLALDVNVSAGNYTELLNKKIRLTQLLDTAITVLQAGGTTANVAVNGLTDLKVAAGSTELTLGQLLQLQTGAPSSALNTNLQVFQLVEAFVQLANSKNGIVVDLPLNIPGLVNGSVQVKVIEPPQLSAVGNPALAKANPMGPDRIFVRTAQVRTVLSLKLPLLSGVTGLLDAITSLPVVNGVTSALNDLLHLNLGGAVSSLLCTLTGTCQVTDLRILPTSTIDIALEVAAADSHVTDYNCASEATKSLTTQTNTSLAKVKVGMIDKVNAFSSSADVTVQPLALIDVGMYKCVLFVCDKANRKAFYGGGLGVKVDAPIASTQSSHVYNMPPEIKQPPLFFSLGTQGVVDSLRATLNGVQIEAYKPTGSSLLGGLLTTAAGALKSVNDTLGAAINGLLSKVLDPILDNLLSALGITLNKVEVGANLSCKPPGRAGLVI